MWLNSTLVHVYHCPIKAMMIMPFSTVHTVLLVFQWPSAIVTQCQHHMPLSTKKSTLQNGHIHELIDYMHVKKSNSFEILNP